MENVFPGNLCVMKANIRHHQKKHHLAIQSMISSSSANSEHPWWSHFSNELFRQYKFSWSTHCCFNCISFLCPLSKECFILDKTWRDPKPLNFYQCHWSPTKRKAFLYSACLELSLARSRLFWPLMAPSGTFHLLQATTSHNILTYKFTITQRHVDFITKLDKCYHKVGELCLITKWDK